MRSLVRAVIYSPIVTRGVSSLMPNPFSRDGLLFDLRHPRISQQVRAEILLRRYERFEIQFISTFVAPHTDVVELGGSLGVLSCFAARNARRYVGVEADTELCAIMERNLRLNFRDHPISVINAAVVGKKPESGRIGFSFDDGNQGGHVAESNGIGKTVRAITLSEVLSESGITGTYSLICDIEGSEIGIFLEDNEALDRCETMVIELHNTAYGERRWTIEEIEGRILNLGYRKVAAANSVRAFRRN